jgi:hypothetical protein
MGGGVYSDWNSLFIKCGCEIVLGRRSIFCISIMIRCSSGIQSEVVVVMCIGALMFL